MNCPTCGAVMVGSPCLNHSEKLVWLCESDPTHWEVRDMPGEFALLDPKDQDAVLAEEAARVQARRSWRF